MSMAVVNPFGSQTPPADVTLTAEGPVRIKSLPLGAIDEQRMGARNTNFSEVGEQAIGTRLSIGTGNAGVIVKRLMSPAVVLRLQFPTRVLPSEPVAISTWKFPFTLIGADSCSVTVCVSPLLLQTGDAPAIDTGAGPVMMKSLPSAAIELHKIVSAKLTVMVD